MIEEKYLTKTNSGNICESGLTFLKRNWKDSYKKNQINRKFDLATTVGKNKQIKRHRWKSNHWNKCRNCDWKNRQNKYENIK